MASTAPGCPASAKNKARKYLTENLNNGKVEESAKMQTSVLMTKKGSQNLKKSGIFNQKPACFCGQQSTKD